MYLCHNNFNKNPSFMKNLIPNQQRLLSNSEKALLNIFSAQLTKTHKDELPEELIKVKESLVKMNSNNSLADSLKMMNLENYSTSLYETIINIEESVSKKSAIKYLEGYLEYNSITIEEVFFQSNELLRA